MDGTGNGGLNDDEGGDAAALLIDALNAQVVPQLRHLSHGALAVAASEALCASVAREGVTATATVLQLRVELGGKLYGLAVHIVVNPCS